MSDLHIDDFYKDVAISFLHLYQFFPRKTILYVEDVCGADQPDEFGLHSPRFLSGFSTLVWLGDQGYLSYQAPIKQEALDQAVLTEKGFLLLSSRSSVNFGDPFTDANPFTDNSEDVNSRGDDGDDGLPLSVIEQSKSNISQLRKAVKSGSSIMISQCVRHLLSTAYQSQ